MCFATNCRVATAATAAGVTWFSLASLLLPAALSETVMAAGLALPAVLLARVCVVSNCSTVMTSVDRHRSVLTPGEQVVL